MSRLTPSLVISVIVIVAVWLVSQAMGFHVSLLWSLALTIGLTLIVNLAIGAFRSRRDW